MSRRKKRSTPAGSPPRPCWASSTAASVGKSPRTSSGSWPTFDVHDEILYWQVVAIEPGYTCATIDYGTWPGQHLRYFAQSDPQQSLSKVYPAKSKEGVIYAGLHELLAKHLLPRRYPREGGGDMPIDLVASDAGYQPETIAAVIRAMGGSGAKLWPTKGVPFGPAKKPYGEYRPEPGVILGRHWRRAVTKAVNMLTLEMDVNRWKSFARDRVLTKPGDRAPGRCSAATPASTSSWPTTWPANIRRSSQGPGGRWNNGPRRRPSQMTTGGTTWSTPCARPRRSRRPKTGGVGTPEIAGSRREESETDPRRMHGALKGKP